MNYREEASPSATQEMPQRLASRHEPDLLNDLVCYARQYAQQKPEVAALWCFGIGFILGWKLKPW